MKRVAALVGLGLATLATAAPGLVQLGEVQAGVVGSYGTSKAFGPGAGLVLGVATGRLVYVGVRWTDHAGSTTAGVKTSAQALAADLGVMIPVGRLDVIGGVSIGVVQFAQRAGSARSHRVEFLAAPGLAAELHVAPVALIPEVQYSLAGDPELTQPVRHRGFIVSLRLVIPIEVGRIRR